VKLERSTELQVEQGERINVPNRMKEESGRQESPLGAIHTTTLTEAPQFWFRSGASWHMSDSLKSKSGVHKESSDSVFLRIAAFSGLNC
jgi:hypothetical protein